ncbi:MAG: DUF6279 family lipoprotein [Gammaproteobacteria bacterium]|nr:DUF6279 family lipoprotein [Gammaproteobacteria bacterium]
MDAPHAGFRERRFRRVEPRWPAVVALVLVAAAAGCSIARFAYNHADWLLLRELDAYTDLSPAQQARAASRLRRQLEIHRRTELPGYARYLRRVRLLAADGISVEDAAWIIETGHGLARHTIAGVIPAIAASLAELSPRQLAHLESHLAEANRNYRKEYLPGSREMRIAGRTRRTLSRIEHWTGELRPDQRRLVERLRNDIPESTEEWLDYNIDQQHTLLNLLRGGANAGEIEAFLHGWWVDQRGRSPSLARNNELMVEKIGHLIASVDETLDQRQRSFLLWRLDAYIRQVDDLMQYEP